MIVCIQTILIHCAFFASRFTEGGKYLYNKLNNNNFINKLINRISPETSENRILHAGFSIILMSEEITQTLSGLSSDMIIFILSGSITIYSTKEEKKTIGEQYMIFLRSFENYTYDITLGSKIIIFFFDSLTMNELPYYQHPYGMNEV